jgi:hypothetical protein
MIDPIELLKFPEIEPRCSICHPDQPLSPYLCRGHKRAGLVLAQLEGIRFTEAAGELYLKARSVYA